MKPGTITKLNKRNTATSKKFDDGVMSTNCDVIVLFPIYDQFAALRKPDSGCMVSTTYIFINSNLLCYKTWKQNQQISNTILLLLNILFLPKNVDFLQKISDISKIKGILILKSIFSETTYVCVLTYQFQVSNIILTTFRWGGGGGGGDWGGGTFTPSHHKTAKWAP